MRHCTVSAPIESCNLSNLSSPTLRYCVLHFLQGQVLYFTVEPKSKTKELYNQTCAYLASQGMLDTDIFGLAIILDDEYLFVDPDYKLSKYAPKNWRSSSTHGLDNSGKPLLAFYFRVQFYVDSPLLLRDETSRHHYYLQLRYNVAYRNLVYAYVAEEIMYLLVGLALQADFGDYAESRHVDNYFSLREYFPQQMVAHGNETQLYYKATVIHKANCTLSKAQAESQFIREASSRDSFSLVHNSHVYRLKQKKHEQNPGTIWLAICTRGIELYEEKSNKPISGTFLWNNIGKLCFDRKKFEIRSLNPPGERMIYYTNSDEKSKHLLTLCRLTHQFCMAIQPRINELAHKEEEEKKQYHDWGAELNMKLTEVCYSHNADQRISVISTTSSNTTSGIVSDRVHSLDESEDDLDMEIMINSPPAVSIESLALAHLRDSFHKESKKFGKNISHDSSPVYYSTVETQDEIIDSSCLSKLTLPTTPAPTDGSQCSSSCSTVVVSSYSHEKAKTQQQESSVLRANKRHSASSSLELGYSHTAQNSALSDSASCCLELDYSVQSAQTSSGIYTLQSSCETNTVATTAAAGSSETSGICHSVVAGSSETSGICHSVVEDSDGARSRSGSIVSASGSFHGDGSDPSDTGHGTPLTAEELSDLIVGRSPKPCRGKYPSIATVSESLDSVADYVTLPPPPIPPPCCIPSKINDAAPLQYTLSSKNSDSSSYMARPDLVSNRIQNSNKKYYTEEAMLQRQIQFQHLAAGFSSHLLMDALPNQLLTTSKPSHTCLNNDTPAKLGLHNSEYSAGYNVTHSKHQQNHKSCASLPLRTEEANARIISSKPQINLLTAQSVPSGSLVPSYATPTTRFNGTRSFRSQQICGGYHSKFTDVSLRTEHCNNSVPIVGSNNYLDVRRSGAAFLQQIHEKFPPPPPLLYNRQPPPPPPPPRNNVLPHPIDQYRQQLYSDVDYVIYPMKDPAISKQEYLDSKKAAFYCSQYLSQNSLNSKCSRPYNLVSPATCSSLYDRTSHAMYRSTPNVAVAGSCIPQLRYQYPNSRYASNQNLTSELLGFSNSSLAYLSSKYSSSTSPLYSAATSLYSSSMQSLRRDSSIYGRILPSSSNCSFTRAHSHDNILNCKRERKAECSNSNLRFRKPPPPPPPYYSQNLATSSVENSRNFANCFPNVSASEVSNFKNANISHNAQGSEKNGSLDICSLIEKSKNFDLPLISALCNDKSLLKQTNTSVGTRNEEFDKQRSNWFTDAEKKIAENVIKLKSNASYSTVTAVSSNVTLHKSALNSVKSIKSNSVSTKDVNQKIASPTAPSLNKKKDSIANSNKISFNFNGASKFSICDSQSCDAVVESSKSSSSVGLKQLSSNPGPTTAKIKSNHKPVNAKLPKSSSSLNKLKYPVSQPIKNAVKKNSAIEGKDKMKSKPVKVNELGTQRSGSKN